jgi:hypothetical protein
VAKQVCDLAARFVAFPSQLVFIYYFARECFVLCGSPLWKTNPEKKAKLNPHRKIFALAARARYALRLRLSAGPLSPLKIRNGEEKSIENVFEQASNT